MQGAATSNWRIIAVLGWLASGGAGWLTAAEATSPVAVTHAVLVHGIWQNNVIGLGNMRREFENRGVTCLVPSLKPCDGRDGLKPLAEQLKSEVDREFGPTRRFVLVGFSMGGLVGRSYLQDLGGAARCDALITIATPHHGTLMAGLYPGKGALEMRPGSAFLRRLESGERRLGNMPLVSYRTPFDMVIVPTESSVWEPAENVEIPCPAHPLMTCSPTLLANLLERLKCPEEGGTRLPARVRP